MPRTLLSGASLLLLGLGSGCSTEAPHEATEVPRATAVVQEPADVARESAEVARESPVPGGPSISDEEIDLCIAWWHEQTAIVRRQLEEGDEFEEYLKSKYSFAEIHKVQEDPELLAMIERQVEEQREHRRNHPVSRATVDGFDSVLAGLGRSVHHDGQTVYEIVHDDSALRGARGRYGDAFVDKVLSREQDIAAAMIP